MDRALKFLATLIMVSTIFTLAVNIPSIYNQYTTIRNVEKVMIRYGQKNGGFMPTNRSHIETADDKLREYIKKYKLEDKIKDVKYYPGLGVPVQKRDKFKISITPIIEVSIPFYKTVNYDAKPIEEYGYSHKYFK